ncbi:hypothetical protein ACO3UB_08335 (plasmid) [Methanocaldococcus sp. 16A]
MQSNKELRKMLEEAWVNVVAACIVDAGRKGSLGSVIKSRGKKEALDWMEHRLEFSKHECSVPRVIQKFANHLSLQAPELPLEDIEFLREHEEEALDVLREMPKLIILKAAQNAGLLKSNSPKNKTAKLTDFIGGGQ